MYSCKVEREQQAGCLSRFRLHEAPIGSPANVQGVTMVITHSSTCARCVVQGIFCVNQYNRDSHGQGTLSHMLLRTTSYKHGRWAIVLHLQIAMHSSWASMHRLQHTCFNTGGKVTLTDAVAIPMAFHRLPVAAYTGAATITPCTVTSLGKETRCKDIFDVRRTQSETGDCL